MTCVHCLDLRGGYRGAVATCGDIHPNRGPFTILGLPEDILVHILEMLFGVERYLFVSCEFMLPKCGTCERLLQADSGPTPSGVCGGHLGGPKENWPFMGGA